MDLKSKLVRWDSGYWFCEVPEIPYKGKLTDEVSFESMDVFVNKAKAVFKMRRYNDLLKDKNTFMLSASNANEICLCRDCCKHRQMMQEIEQDIKHEKLMRKVVRFSETLTYYCY